MSDTIYPMLLIRTLYVITLPGGTEVGTFQKFTCQGPINNERGPKERPVYRTTLPDGTELLSNSVSHYFGDSGWVHEKGKVRQLAPEAAPVAAGPEPVGAPQGSLGLDSDDAVATTGD